jgi:uncharacterized protein YecE (DUF72 family)
MAIFSAGTSNIELLEKNKLAFPPEFQSKSRLAYYSSLFNSVEINSTFYRLPLPTTLEKWAMEVPDEFRFTLKLWREITHARELAFTEEQLEKFMRIADHIGQKKGALLIQLPAGTQSIHTDRLDKLLAGIEKHDPQHSWQIAVEFRHRSWYAPQIYALLDAHQAALVWHDRPLMDEDGACEHGPFIYLRFHGPKGDYKGSYSDDFLLQKAKEIESWLTRGKNVYTYFNNTMEGDAPRNLITLKRYYDTANSDERKSSLRIPS